MPVDPLPLSVYVEKASADFSALWGLWAVVAEAAAVILGAIIGWWRAKKLLLIPLFYALVGAIAPPFLLYLGCLAHAPYALLQLEREKSEEHLSKENALRSEVGSLKKELQNKEAKEANTYQIPSRLGRLGKNKLEPLIRQCRDKEIQVTWTIAGDVRYAYEIMDYLKARDVQTKFVKYPAGGAPFPDFEVYVATCGIKVGF